MQGPHVAAFEEAFGRFLGGQGYVRAVSMEYGRMGPFLAASSKSHAVPVPSRLGSARSRACLLGHVPEITRVAGLKPVFADVDPRTFTLSPEAMERAITPNTRAVLPTHLYGLPCDMDPILALARRHNLKVIEDCAHSLGATYRGRPAGTFGDASFFSFQAFKPLNTYGGGMAWMRDAELSRCVGEMADAEPWPEEKRVLGVLRSGKLQHTFIRPRVFTYSGFPIFEPASWIDAKPDRLSGKIRSLDQFHCGYRAVQQRSGGARARWTGSSARMD